MIKTPVSGQLDCLRLAGIKHDMFISRDQCELHLWDDKRLHETIIILNSREITIDSIVSVPDSEPSPEHECFYIIKF